MMENNDDIPSPHEGAFDAQLSFPLPFVAAPSAIEWIVKRDGRQEKFEQRKIVEAIFNAVKASGGDDLDRAQSLASGVTIYLAKLLNGTTPTVDQVHDAVEKVLIELGHARTAIAYVRYRDRRARQRALHNGGAHAILKELDEAQRQRETIESTTPRPLFVSTSDEQVAGWDRARIVEALTRETRMPEDDAERVAKAVESLVERASLTTLTAPLVRELVDSKLVELGLERYRARHMRLGVPLYDAEQIICSPNQGEIEGQQDPASTDVTLAQRVKREFALAAVHSAEVTDAHLRGDIHLHGLSQIDRFHSASHSVEFIKRFGLAIFSGSRFSPPPTTANGLIAQTSRFTAAMQRHFIEGVHWRGFNESLTPILGRDANMDRIARLALFGLITPVGTPPATLEFCWPQWNIAACMFAMQFAEVWGATIDEGSAYGMPNIEIAVNPDALQHNDFRAMLGLFLESYERRRHVIIRFARESSDEASVDWPADDLVGGVVTLNLPRAAYEASGIDSLHEALAARARLAFAALMEKRDFLERLFAFGGIGPLAALSFRYRNRAYADPRDARYVLGVTGLNECVQRMTGVELYRSAASIECAHAFLQRLCQEADAFSLEEQIRIVVGADDSAACARRFARIDLQQHGDLARATAKRDAITRDATYTPGVSTSGRVRTIEEISNECELHSHMDMSGPIAVESSDMTSASIEALIEEALTRTSCRSLRFVCGREQMDFENL